MWLLSPGSSVKPQREQALMRVGQGRHSKMRVRAWNQSVLRKEGGRPSSGEGFQFHVCYFLVITSIISTRNPI